MPKEEHEYTCIATAPDPRPWNSNSDFLNHIFCAALQGFIANKYFFEGYFQGSPKAAVEFADSVVLAAMTHKPTKDEGSTLKSPVETPNG